MLSLKRKLGREKVKERLLALIAHKPLSHVSDNRELLHIDTQQTAFINSVLTLYSKPKTREHAQDIVEDYQQLLDLKHFVMLGEHFTLGYELCEAPSWQEARLDIREYIIHNTPPGSSRSIGFYNNDGNDYTYTLDDCVAISQSDLALNPKGEVLLSLHESEKDYAVRFRLKESLFQCKQYNLIVEPARQGYALL